MSYYIGVDVGTGSARAALVTDCGKIVKTAVEPIKTWHPRPDFYEQSSENIWQSVIKCVKDVVRDEDPRCISGIGFDATCSLVCVDNIGNPLTVSDSGNNEQNIILWMDHRALKEADAINSTNHPVLQYVGGKISPEMETPKLLWIKKNLPETWTEAGKFFDLPDFLTWKATGCDSRSSCSLVCKWTYEMNQHGVERWNKQFFVEIGLEDLSSGNWEKIGSTVLPPGSPVGMGLSNQAAKEFGLPSGTPVGTSMIDAHAGGLGLIGCKVDGIDSNFETRVGLICGTSTCHMAVLKNPVFSPGMWGPYKDAMIPGMWLNEGGQSASGKLIDHIIDSHPATEGIKKKIGDMHIQVYLNKILHDLARKRGLKHVAYLTKDLHVWPDFHGNRSPIADPSLKGMICGLSLAHDDENLALLYLATVQALSYGTRHIMQTLKECGYDNIKSTLICGGLSTNNVFTETQADVCNLPVIRPHETESVLLGAAILGAVASQRLQSLEDIILTMGGSGTCTLPNPEVIEYHNRKYEVFLKMYQDQMSYSKIMG